MFAATGVVELPIPEPEGAGRHAVISIGGGATLYAFELAKIATPPERPMFERGRIDQFALNVSEWVGGEDPGQADASEATDAERTAHRLWSPGLDLLTLDGGDPAEGGPRFRE